MASVIARKSSTACDGVPSGRRAWMWIITPPSSAIRRASAAYSAGVYGIAGHCSRPASAPDTAQVRMTGSSTLRAGTLASDGIHTVPAPRTLQLLVLREPQRPDDRRAGLAGVDHIVDHPVPRGDVDVDEPAVGGDQLGPLRRRVLRLLHLLAEHDLHRALGAHHGDLRARPGDDQVGLIGA